MGSLFDMVRGRRRPQVNCPECGGSNYHYDITQSPMATCNKCGTRWNFGATH